MVLQINGEEGVDMPAKKKETHFSELPVNTAEEAPEEAQEEAAQEPDPEPPSLNLWQRMIVARKHMLYIKKTRHGTLKYATINHDEVTVAAREALDKVDVLSIPNVLMHEKSGNTTVCEVEVEFVNPDNPKERYSVTMFGENNNNQDKGPGGAISYATKYCYLKGLMGETGEKDADMQDLDSDKPSASAPESTEPSDKEKEDIDKQDLYDQLDHVIKANELDKTYVWGEICSRSKDATPHMDELAHFVKHVTEHPDLWNKPEAEND